MINRFKLIKACLLCFVAYIAYTFCLNFAYLNLVTPDKDDAAEVLVQGTASLNKHRFFLPLKQAAGKDLYLELEYFNPSRIDSPDLFLGNNLMERYKTDRIRPGEASCLKRDHFRIPGNLINSRDNELLIEFMAQYPSEVTVRLTNFKYKFPSNNLFVFSSGEKEKLRYINPSSYFRIPLFFLAIIMINALMSRIRKLRFMHSFLATNVILLGLNAVFIIMLLLNLLAPFTIKITAVCFTKLVIFYFYIIALFTAIVELNQNKLKKLILNNKNSPDYCRIIIKNRILFYFSVILMLSLGFALVELAMISRAISVIGDIIIVIICLRFFKGSFQYFKKERLYYVSP